MAEHQTEDLGVAGSIPAHGILILFFKGIIGFQHMHTNRLFYICLGKAHPSKTMIWRLNNVNNKYKKVFGEQVPYVKAFLDKVLKWVNKYSDQTIKIEKLKENIESSIKETSIKEIGKEKNISINSELFEVIRKYWWKYPSKIDRTILKFLCSVGWLSSKEDYDRSCKLCGNIEIGKEHYLNYCTKTATLRIKLKSNKMMPQNSELTDSMMKLFFTQNLELGGKKIREIISLFQNTFGDLIKLFHDQEEQAQ